MLAFTPWRMVEAELCTHAQLPTANLGAGRSASAKAEFRRSTRETVRAWCLRTISFALLSVCSKVAVGQVVAGQTLVSRDSGASENRRRETSKPTHVNLVGRQTRRRADRTVVWELDVRELQVPVVLSFIDDHSENWSHSVVHSLNASVTVWMIGACGKLAHSQSW